MRGFVWRPKNMTALRLKLFSVILVSLLMGGAARAQDLDLAGNVSWDRFGNGIHIFAEAIHNDRTSGASGFLRLQIWATDQPDDGTNALSGYVLGTFNLGSLSAGSQFANVGRTVRYFRPPPGIYYTTITLEEETVDGFQIVDSENFTQPIETFGAVNFGGFGEGNAHLNAGNGDVGFVEDVSWLAGNGRVQFFAEKILNERPSGQSGVLRLKLWATSTPYAGEDVLQGYPMATKRVGRVNAGSYLLPFSRQSFFRPPPEGTYYVTMTLEELVRGKWEIVDYVTFDGLNIF